MSTENKRLVIVRAVRDQHLTPTQAAARYRVSRQWVYELLKRYDAHGSAGLAQRSRAPGHRPGATDADIAARICQHIDATRDYQRPIKPTQQPPEPPENR